MGLLRSYSFGSFLGVDEVPENVLNLFQKSTKEGRQIKYASEIIFAGIKGKINLDKPFYLEAYEYTIDMNSTHSKNKRKKKELYIDTSSSGDELDNVYRMGGIPEEKLTIDNLEDAFEAVCDSEELLYAVNKIKEVNTELIAVEEVDIIESIKLALSGYTRALEELKRICDFYPRIANYIKVILSSGYSVNEVFA